MRPIHYIYILLAAFTLAACDEISADERFSAEPVAFTPLKNVLVEDFTGQNCLNCPNAADAVHALQRLYGEEHVIAVAIHGGGLKLPLPYSNPMQLATEQGDAWNERWNIDSWPAGMVDRSGGLLEYTAWSALAVERLQRAAPIGITVAVLDDDAASLQPDSLTLDVGLTASADVEGALNLWLAEDSIVAFQRMPDGSANTQYVHNHVFRTALTPAAGDAVSLAAGEERHIQYGLRIPATWKSQNLWPVAFIDGGDSGILQAARGTYVGRTKE